MAVSSPRSQLPPSSILDDSHDDGDGFHRNQRDRGSMNGRRYEKRGETWRLRAERLHEKSSDSNENGASFIERPSSVITHHLLLASATNQVTACLKLR